MTIASVPQPSIHSGHLARTGQLPKHDESHVEGVDEGADGALRPEQGTAAVRP